jgi:hypothetical protein
MEDGMATELIIQKDGKLIKIPVKPTDDIKDTIKKETAKLNIDDFELVVSMKGIGGVLVNNKSIDRREDIPNTFVDVTDMTVIEYISLYTLNAKLVQIISMLKEVL